MVRRTDADDTAAQGRGGACPPSLGPEGGGMGALGNPPPGTKTPLTLHMLGASGAQMPGSILLLMGKGPGRWQLDAWVLSLLWGGTLDAWVLGQG